MPHDMEQFVSLQTRLCHLTRQHASRYPLGRLVGCCTGSEVLARVGEAEFALMIPNSGADHATKVVKRLHQILRAPAHVAGLVLDARVGIGIALFPGHATEADVLIRRANAAMHLAQPVAGGYAMYTGRLEQEYTRGLALMGDLHRAIEENELRLFCQPKVDIASHTQCGAETLVRWEHLRFGMIAPAEFVKLAEQAGSITPLTHWMLDAVFSQSYAWQEANVPRVPSTCRCTTCTLPGWSSVSPGCSPPGASRLNWSRLS